jgi:hypothetical protein
MKFFSAALLVLPFALQAQQVQNVKAVQTNEEVIVIYDLVDTKPVYVSLYYSKDGGTTFSPELRQVSGDVKANVKPGAGKKITWNAAKELVVYDGDLVFKVEANSKKIGYPKAFADEFFSLEATKAYFDGNNLKVEFLVTNISDRAVLRAFLPRDGALLLDEQGGIFEKPDVRIIGITFDSNSIEFSKDAPFKGIAIIKNVNPEMNIVSLLKISFEWDFTRHNYSVKNIPITK